VTERSLDVLIVQLPPEPNDVGANLATAIRTIDEHPAAGLAVFPELFLNGYSLAGMRPLDLTTPSSPLAGLQQAARRTGTALVVGAAERVRRGVADSAICIDEEGAIAASYRKVHLFGEEHRWFRAGDGYVVVELAGVKVAQIICYDLEFPEPARAVAAAGAELLVTIAANMDPYANEHALFLRARAAENRLPHVYSNRVGDESGFRFCGSSGIADASGRVLAELAPYEPEVHLAHIAIGERPLPDYLADVRPGLPVDLATPATLGSGP
jgi:predicted amidohydrolase